MKKTKDVKTVEELFAQIRQAASGGSYIYRGESSKEYPNFPKVSSALYRDYQKQIDAKNFDIEAVEKAIIDEVRERTHEKEDEVILEQLQHYGGKTNQIDFTTDYLIALFFACYGRYEKDGRLILLNEKGVNTHKPTTPQNRVIAQKSIFVRSSKGFVEPDNEVTVPSKLKKHVLEYLNKYHNINTATIYNDIHGYIAQKAIHQDAYTHFYRGLTYQSKGEIDKAIKAYTESIERNPNLAEVYNNRGIVYSNKNDYNLAIADYNKAIQLNPNYAEAYSNRGNAYGKISKYGIAVVDHNKAIELDPNLAKSYANRGNAYSEKGDLDLAIASFNKAIELDPSLAEIYNNRGNAYSEKGEHDLSLASFNKAIELNPNYAMAYRNRGVTYNDKRDYDHAIIDFNKAIELNPTDAMAYSNRGGVYSKKGERTAAFVDYNKAIELNPNYVEAHYNRGITKEAMQDHKGARKDLETALRLAERQDKKDFSAHIQKEINELLDNSDK